MDKKKVLWIILDLIFLVVFNAVFFFLAGPYHQPYEWVSYFFIHFSYIMLLITPYLVRRSVNTSVLGFPLFTISTIYFVITFLVNVVLMFIPQFDIKMPVVANLVMTGIYGVLMVSHMLANEHTAESVERHQVELVYVKESSRKLDEIMDSISDKKLFKQVESLYDLIHSSPVKSDDSVHEYQSNVLNLIDKLAVVIASNDEEKIQKTILEIKQNAEERNRNLKFGQ